MRVKPPHQWKPGESGNPKGRPKGSRSISDYLRRFGELDTPEQLREKMRAMFPQVARKGDKFTMEEALWLSAYVHAIKGESWAFNFIADRTEGKAVQPTKDLTESKDVEIVIGGRPFRVNNNHDTDAETPRQ